MSMPTIERVAYVPQPKYNEFVPLIQEVSQYPENEMAQAEFATEREANTFLVNIQRAAQENFDKGTVTVKKSLVCVADAKGNYPVNSDDTLADTGWTRGTVSRKNRETKETQEVEGYTYTGGKTILGFRVTVKEPKK